MQTVLMIVQVVAAVILTIFILLQVKGNGFGRSFGSSASFSRRGLERLVFRGTFLVAFIFLIASVARLLI